MLHSAERPCTYISLSHLAPSMRARSNSLEAKLKIPEKLRDLTDRDPRVRFPSNIAAHCAELRLRL